MRRARMILIAALRLWALGMLLALYLLMRGSQFLENSVAPTGHMRLTATPVLLDPRNPKRTRLGDLDYIGGWIMRANVPQFGGISSLHVVGNHFIGLSDTGALSDWHFDGRGQPHAAQIKPLPTGCLFDGQTKAMRDSESMAFDAPSGKVWVGFEWVSRICRYDSGFTHAEALTVVPQMARWSKVAGPESLLRLPDGRFLSIAEDTPEDKPARPMLVFDRDPTDPRVQVTEMFYDAPDDYSPSDMAQLPDGRIVVLNRVFTPPGHLFRVIVSLMEPFAVKAGAHVKSRVLARFDPPVVNDNFEALAITTEQGVPILWIMSDDNYMDFQRTFLLKFAFRG